MKRKSPIWQLPAIIVGGIAALTALGGSIVMASKYITLPEKIEAAERKNVEQDKAIDKLTAIEETWQKVYQQQQEQRQPTPAPAQPNPPQHLWWSEDKQGQWWWCDNPEEKLCWTNSEWVEE